MIASALVHPVYLGTLAILCIDPNFLWRHGNAFASAMIGLNLFNLAAGFIAVCWLASRTLALRGRRLEAVDVAFLPLYWLLIWAACIRAFFHLFSRPHNWEKTPHRGSGDARDRANLAANLSPSSVAGGRPRAATVGGVSRSA
jgi:glycosyltransferase XagB